MYKKILLLFSIIFLFPNLVLASVFINEIQPYPTEERFIELYNTGDSSVDLSGWYIQRKTATGSSFSSLVSNPNFEGKIIGAQEYFLISRVALSGSDIVLSTLTVTESNTIQIKNPDGVIIDKVGWGDSSDCNSSCPPNPLNGQSIYKTVTGSWSVGLPTPNAINEASSNLLDEALTPSNSTEENIYLPSSKKEQKTTTQILTKKFAFVGVPIEFKVNTIGHYGETLLYGKYFWNFGDGDFKEMRVNEVEKFTHTYFYPGEYDVNLEYYMNYYSENPEAINNVVIKVISPDIVISRVGDKKDFFIELTNNTNYDADISNWILLSNRTSFVLPKNTILRSKKTMIISSHLINFSIEDKNTLKLMTLQREVIYDYSASTVYIPPTKKITKSASINTYPPVSAVQPLENTEQTSINGLEASPILSTNANNNKTSLIPTFAFVLFLGVSSGAVFFIRRKRSSTITGDDFELIDE